MSKNSKKKKVVKKQPIVRDFPKEWEFKRLSDDNDRLRKNLIVIEDENRKLRQLSEQSKEDIKDLYEEMKRQITSEREAWTFKENSLKNELVKLNDSLRQTVSVLSTKSGDYDQLKSEYHEAIRALQNEMELQLDNWTISVNMLVDNTCKLLQEFPSKKVNNHLTSSEDVSETIQNHHTKQETIKEWLNQQLLNA